MERRFSQERRSSTSSSGSVIVPLLEPRDKKGATGEKEFDSRAISQKISIDSEDIYIIVSGVTHSTLGSILYFVTCAVTLGLGYVFFKSMPQWRAYLMQSTCPLQSCEEVLIKVGIRRSIIGYAVDVT